MKQTITLLNIENEIIIRDSNTTHEDFLKKFKPLFEDIKKIGKYTYKVSDEKKQPDEK
jgi:hypothetical protein